ncbi:MAG: glycosyltransferase family 9 protein ['Candidatus Kapabacteria' thiocyanatum]|uniref:Uncharacterized protein n=1 Tax=Candidatus Kapaibacterium thiocyanatum TaxID=1895771 RepID=A0A1M3KXY3_9BACT|nr:glycosyltransferase family 9 protein ['Candidatus Kapabacteria' thiocyanatum]OJX57306.1 MAG: hypothetical protein BGO89_12550 ['Candidatus Kapabacteria' thiocyanatum]
MSFKDAIKRLLYLPARLRWRRGGVQLPLDPSSVRSILILRYDAIGDMIVTTPLFDALRSVVPDAAIDVVASNRNAGLLADDDRIRHVHVYDGSRSAFRAVRKACRRQRYDVVISLVMNKTTKAGLMANRLGGSKAITVSFENAARRDLYATWFDVQVPVERNVSAMAEMQLRIVEALFGVRCDPASFPMRIRLDAANERFAAQQVRGNEGHHTIGFNLSAGNPYRMWSEERNAEFLTLLMAVDADTHIVLFSDGARRDMALRLASMDPSRISCCEPTKDFRSVVATLGRMDVVITPDTSVVHAAAAMGTPVVVMYSLKASFLVEWQPFGVPHRVAYTNGREDLETLEPAEVLQAYMELMSVRSGR